MSQESSRWRRVLVATTIVTAALAGTAGPSRAAPDSADSAAAPAVSSDTGAFVQSESWVNSRTLDLTIKSPSTERDTAKVRLLLPTGWSKNASRTWPTLFLLHGGFDNYTSWYDQTEIEQLAASRQ